MKWRPLAHDLRTELLEYEVLRSVSVMRFANTCARTSSITSTHSAWTESVNWKPASLETFQENVRSQPRDHTTLRPETLTQTAAGSGVFVFVGFPPGEDDVVYARLERDGDAVDLPFFVVGESYPFAAESSQRRWEIVGDHKDVVVIVLERNGESDHVTFEGVTIDPTVAIP